MVERFPDELRPEDYRQRAADRARASASGVGAAVERRAQNGGLDGVLAEAPILLSRAELGV